VVGTHGLALLMSFSVRKSALRLTEKALPVVRHLIIKMAAFNSKMMATAGTSMHGIFGRRTLVEPSFFLPTEACILFPPVLIREYSKAWEHSAVER